MEFFNSYFFRWPEKRYAFSSPAPSALATPFSFLWRGARQKPSIRVGVFETISRFGCSTSLSFYGPTQIWGWEGANRLRSLRENLGRGVAPSKSRQNGQSFPLAPKVLAEFLQVSTRTIGAETAQKHTYLFKMRTIMSKHVKDLKNAKNDLKARSISLLNTFSRLITAR